MLYHLHQYSLCASSIGYNVRSLGQVNELNGLRDHVRLSEAVVSALEEPISLLLHLDLQQKFQFWDNSSSLGLNEHATESATLMDSVRGVFVEHTRRLADTSRQELSWKAISISVEQVWETVARDGPLSICGYMSCSF